MKFFETQEESFASRVWYAFGQLLSFFPDQDNERSEELDQRVGSYIQKAMDTYQKPEDPKESSQE